MTATVTVVEHPLALHRLTILRDRTTTKAGFRTAMHDLASMLIYEALATMPTEQITVQTPLEATVGYRPVAQPVFVPILRAALGMVDAALRWAPDADVGFVGLARNEHTFTPDSYLDKLPASLADRPTFILDPMLATGGSLAHCCQLVADRGAPTPLVIVCVLAAPDGIAKLTDWSAASGIDLDIFTAAVDDRLNESAYIVPGLGDAGDRQF